MATPVRPDARSEFQATDTGRVESFSDGVFAVAVTILALEMTTPPHRSGELRTALLHQWPVYLGYLTSFSYIGVIWLNHHQAFTRVRVMDRELHMANLALLFTTAALPFPTGVLADALREEFNSDDVRTAVVLYAIVAAAMCTGWAWIYLHLALRPHLLDANVSSRFAWRGVVLSAVGIVLYLLGGGLGWEINPAIAFAAFLFLPLFYFVTSGSSRIRHTSTR